MKLNEIDWIKVIVFLVMIGGLIFLGIKAYQPADCQAEFNNGRENGLAVLIQTIQDKGIAVIGLPNNQSFEVTHPSLCEAIVQARAAE